MFWFLVVSSLIINTDNVTAYNEDYDIGWIPRQISMPLFENSDYDGGFHGELLLGSSGSSNSGGQFQVQDNDKSNNRDDRRFQNDLYYCDENSLKSLSVHLRIFNCKCYMNVGYTCIIKDLSQCELHYETKPKEKHPVLEFGAPTNFGLCTLTSCPVTDSLFKKFMYYCRMKKLPRGQIPCFDCECYKARGYICNLRKTNRCEHFRRLTRGATFRAPPNGCVICRSITRSQAVCTYMKKCIKKPSGHHRMQDKLVMDDFLIFIKFDENSLVRKDEDYNDGRDNKGVTPKGDKENIDKNAGTTTDTSSEGSKGNDDLNSLLEARELRIPQRRGCCLLCRALEPTKAFCVYKKECLDMEDTRHNPDKDTKLLDEVLEHLGLDASSNTDQAFQENYTTTTTEEPNDQIWPDISTDLSKVKCNDTQQYLINMKPYWGKCTFCVCSHHDWLCHNSEKDCPELSFKNAWCEDPVRRESIVLWHYGCFACECLPGINVMACEVRHKRGNWEEGAICDRKYKKLGYVNLDDLIKSEDSAAMYKKSHHQLLKHPNHLNSGKAKKNRLCDKHTFTLFRRKNYCEICACHHGEWVCTFYYKCFHSYNFSNKMCERKDLQDHVVYYQKDCYECRCDPKTSVMRCVKNLNTENEEYCAQHDAFKIYTQ